MRAGHSDYLINTDAIAYMGASKLPQYVLEPIIANLDTVFANDAQWDDFLAKNGIDGIWWDMPGYWDVKVG